MFHVGDRVMVEVEGYAGGTIIRDEGGGDYRVELDRTDPATGQKKIVGVQGRYLRKIEAQRGPIGGMMAKRTPLTAKLDLDAPDEPEGEKPDAPGEGETKPEGDEPKGT